MVNFIQKVIYRKTFFNTIKCKYMSLSVGMELPK